MAGCRTAVEPVAGSLDARLDQQELQLLHQAESSLQKRDYAKALGLVDQAITCCAGRYPERALQILTTVLAAPGHPIGDHSHAARCFKDLENPISESVTGPAARCWAAALNEVLANETEIQKLKHSIRELEKQIEQLKAVDLEPETPKPGGNGP